MPSSPTLVCSARGAHAHLRLHVLVSSVCQRHLVQNVLVWRLLSGRNTQICSWRPTPTQPRTHTRTKALNSCNLDKGNNNVNAVCNKATIMHLLSRSLIGDDKSCLRLVALVPCVSGCRVCHSLLFAVTRWTCFTSLPGSPQTSRTWRRARTRPS